MKKKILIVGCNSYLANGISFDLDKYSVCFINRPLAQHDFYKYSYYDYIINFCIQPEFFLKNINENEMIDIQIARKIQNNTTKFIFLSSRKVYGSSYKLKTFNELDILNPYDFYSDNKCTVEDKLTNILGDNLLVFRVGNIIGEPSNKPQYNTLIGWIERQLIANKKIYCNINKDVKKDTISRRYFQYALQKSIDLNLSGVYNLGANFALSTCDLFNKILPNNYFEFTKPTCLGEQFILDCSKINSYIEKLEEIVFFNDCRNIKNSFIKLTDKVN